MQFSDSIQISVGQATEAGVKPVNEDRVGVRVPQGNLLATKGIAAIIADGVSAASAGLEAAEMCVKGFLNDYYSTPESWQVKTSGQRIITSLNSWLTSQSRSEFRDEHKGYVTTLSSIVFKSRTAHLFHVGDSRISLLRKENYQRLTTDHATRISADTCYLTRAMGLGMDLKVDYRTSNLEVSDLYILTTDGIHDVLSDAEIQSIIQSSTDKNLDEISETILKKALDAGSADNLTCLLIRIDTLPDGDQEETFRRLSSRPFPPDLEPGMSIDGLKVEKLLTASKNTQLYLVRDPETDKRMVMKTPSLNFRDDPDYIERFLIEEWIGRRVRHPNLIRLFPNRREPKFLYYLMEYIPGITLEEWIEQHKDAPDIKEVVRIIGEVIKGLRALHRKETLHQDIKPANVMLHENGQVKIIDYGSCRVASIREIEVPFERHSALGTLDFSAPEYRLNVRPSTRADQFSIGMLTYHMLTGGQSPYNGKGAKWEKAATLRDFTNLSYTPSYKHQPMVPYWMDGAIHKSLHILPESRYATLSELLHDLDDPNPDFIEVRNLPLIERDPVRFWKALSALLAIATIILLILLSNR